MTNRKWCDTVIYLLHALGIGEYIGGIFVGIGLAVFMKDLGGLNAGLFAFLGFLSGIGSGLFMGTLLLAASEGLKFLRDIDRSTTTIESKIGNRKETIQNNFDNLPKL